MCAESTYFATDIASKLMNNMWGQLVFFYYFVLVNIYAAV